MKAFEEAGDSGRGWFGGILEKGMVLETAVADSAAVPQAAGAGDSGRKYSETDRWIFHSKESLLSFGRDITKYFQACKRSR